MNPPLPRILLRIVLAALLLLAPHTRATEPERIVVLTFDDSVASHATFVAPLLKKLGFGATFFITEGFEFLEDKEHYMTWAQIRALHDQGFEIGNHTRRHTGVGKQKPADLEADIAFIEERCAEHGIPRPTSFCYPGYQVSDTAVEILARRGYQFARAGGMQPYLPSTDHPLRIPQIFDGKPETNLTHFKAAVSQAGEGRILVLTFHGVPDIKHPWVNTDPEKFRSYMDHLKEQGCRVVALRDLKTLLQPNAAPAK